LKLKMVDLFCGSCSFKKIAESRGHEVIGVDINDFQGVDVIADIEFLQTVDLPWIPDSLCLEIIMAAEKKLHGQLI
jgi:hypothetical protein